MNNIELPHLKIRGYEAKYPIIQGGMGIKLSMAELAAAVANYGGIGTITGVGLGFSNEVKKSREQYLADNKKYLIEEIKKTKELSNDGFVGVNIMTIASDYENMIKTACESGIKFIVSGAGMPYKLPEYTKNFPDVAIIPIISTLQGVRVICKKWSDNYSRLPDAIIVENPNTAGGHLGCSREKIGDPKYNPENVIPEIVKYLKETYNKEIPVIAAGGVRNRYDLDKMLSYGASGVQVATPFILTPECNASDAYKKVHLNAESKDIVIIKSPVGMPGRAINTDFAQKSLENLEKYKPSQCVRCLDVCKFLETNDGFYCILSELENARLTGNGVIFSGQWSPRKMQTVEQVMDTLVKY